MEEEVEGQRAEVEERRQESPVLRLTVVSNVGLLGRTHGRVAGGRVAYLAVVKYRAVAVE